MRNAGGAVMLSFYLYYKLPENTIVTVDVISMELFPMGFFSVEQLNTIWNEQKVNRDEREGYTCIGSPDNMIDYLEAWKD